MDTPTPSIPLRPLGRTGIEVTLFGLGGEGVLRTHGRMREAVAVIDRAIALGVNYCDTAPAYSSSMDYYGAALGERRARLILASKTADRTRDGSLRILDDSLRRLRCDSLDVWQLHDLRTISEVDRIFARGGAIEALVEARAAGRVRLLGLTGHHDPAVLREAIRRFPFDTLLVALNMADVHRLSFVQSVLPAAVKRGLAVIGMKVYGAGELVVPRGPATPQDAMGYVLSLPGVSHVIIGCGTAAEVDCNVEAARAFQPFSAEKMRALEAGCLARAEAYTSYKRTA